MTVREAIAQEMEKLSKIPEVVFLGENVINSGRIYHTLDQVPIDRCIEMPIAENLIAGAAIGLALAGFFPICIFQRMDFMLIAADQIINHACQMEKMCGRKMELPILFRTIKAELNEKFFVGHQHSKDFTYIFEPHLSTFVIPHTIPCSTIYQLMIKRMKPTLVVEDYASYNNPA